MSLAKALAVFLNKNSITEETVADLLISSKELAVVDIANVIKAKSRLPLGITRMLDLNNAAVGGVGSNRISL